MRGPVLIERGGGAVVAVYGTVGTFYTGVTVTVFGVTPGTLYTAEVELVLPNGTALRPTFSWWPPNPPMDRVIALAVTTYDLPPVRLSGATLRMTIRELGLTVVIRIPE